MSRLKSWLVLIAMPVFVAVLPMESPAQHCPPITSSYLSEISLKSLEKGSLTVRVEHFKAGGRPKDAYQYYLLAYLEKDGDLFPTPIPEGKRVDGGNSLFDEKKCVILDTRVVSRNTKGFYEFEVTKETETLIKELSNKLLQDVDKTVDGGWGRVNAQVRLAIFVPFLEDERYANLEGLPKDRHECNYAGDRALVWQELPYRLSLHFFEFDNKDNEPKSKKFHLQINGDQRKSTSY